MLKGPSRPGTPCRSRSLQLAGEVQTLAGWLLPWRVCRCQIAKQAASSRHLRGRQGSAGGRLRHQGPVNGVSAGRATGPHACTCAGTAQKQNDTDNCWTPVRALRLADSSKCDRYFHPSLVSPEGCNCDGAPHHYDSALQRHLMLRRCKGTLGRDHTALQSSKPACSKLLSRAHWQSMGYSAGLDGKYEARALSNLELCLSIVHAGGSGQVL